MSGERLRLQKLYFRNADSNPIGFHVGSSISGATYAVQNKNDRLFSVIAKLPQSRYQLHPSLASIGLRIQVPNYGMLPYASLIPLGVLGFLRLMLRWTHYPHTEVSWGHQSKGAERWSHIIYSTYAVRQKTFSDAIP